MHITRALTTLLVGGLVLGLAVPAQAQLAQQGTYSGTVQWSSSGKTYDLEKGHVFFTGEFTGTFVNSAGEGFLHNAAVVCPGVNDVDLHTKKGRARGYCLVTDSAGNRAYLAWQCEGDTVRCLGTFEWTGGTGTYAGLSGNNEFVGVFGPAHPDGSGSGSATWKGAWRLASTGGKKPQRMVSPEARIAMGDALRTGQGKSVWFVTQANDPEAAAFQQELQAVFQEAGWEVGSSAKATYPIKAGVFLLMADDEPGAHVRAVLEGLKATGDVSGGTGYRKYYQEMKEKNPNWRGYALAPDQEFVILIGPQP